MVSSCEARQSLVFVIYIYGFNSHISNNTLFVKTERTTKEILWLTHTGNSKW